MKYRILILSIMFLFYASWSYAGGICDDGVSDADISADAIWSSAEFPFQDAQDALIGISRDVAPALRSAAPAAKWAEHEMLQNSMAVIQGVLTRQQVILAYAALRIAVVNGAPNEEIEKSEKGLAVIKERYCKMLPELLVSASKKATQLRQ